jgi:hypothetical protein
MVEKVIKIDTCGQCYKTFLHNYATNIVTTVQYWNYTTRGVNDGDKSFVKLTLVANVIKHFYIIMPLTS